MSNYFDKYKYVKYNDIYLEDICEIQDIKGPLLTSRTIDTLDISTVDGKVFNGAKYDSHKLELTVLIDEDNEGEYKRKLNELKEAFDTNEPKPFYINQDKFTLAITNEEIEPQDKEALYSREFKITLFCPSPYFYSDDIKKADSENKIITLVNNGNRPALPIISVGFSTDAYFAQLELVETGQKILIGKYPTLGISTVAKSSRVLYDNCETTANWVDSNASIDSDRTGGGTLSVTASGSGVMLNNPGTGETTWKGVCKRANLSKEVDEFRLSCNMSHNSTGISGDPTVFSSDKTSTTQIVSGSKTTYYQVTCSSLNVRSGPGTNYSKLGTLSKGYKIKNGIPSKGWVKFTYNNKTGYCSSDYLTKKVDDSTKTVSEAKTEENMMAYNTTGKGYGTYLRSAAKHNASILCSIQTGEIVRVISSKTYTDTVTNSDGSKTIYKYYKLAKKYNGYIGYVNTVNLLKSGEVTISYDEMEGIDTADDKTGIIELYGFDTNGVKLFCLGMYDDNAWYEYTYPKCVIGSRAVLKDTTKVPEPLKNNTTSGNDGDKTVTISNRLSGRLGSWNEFWGTWVITREKINGQYEWNVEVQKIKDGVTTKIQKSTNIKYTDLPTNPLSYVILYIGTTGNMEKSSSMALTHIQCDEINPTTETEVNIAYFKQGDILELDCGGGGKHEAHLNNEECNNLIDIGSRFFEIPVGESHIKVTSNDTEIVASAIYREKYLGGIQ